MPGTTIDVSEFKHWQDEWIKRNGSPCTGVLKLYTSKKGGRQVLTCRLPTKGRPRKRRRNRRHHAISIGKPRYRERLMPTDYFEGGFVEGGRRIDSGSSLGKVFKYNSSGTLTSTLNVHRTGALPSAIHMERCWDRTNPGPPYRAGGVFTLVKTKIPHSRVYGPIRISSKGNPAMSGQAHEYYDGYVTDGGSWTGDSLNEYTVSTVPTLNGYDTIAWDLLKPTVPKLNLAQTLYELKDLPRMLETTANGFHNLWRSFGGGYSTTMMRPNNVADQFLNGQFGWVPFLDDMGKLIDLWRNLDKYIAQTVRDNGTWIKRRRVLDSTENIQQLHWGPGTATEPQSTDSRFSKILRTTGTIAGLGYSGFHTISLVERTKVWAVGSFKYFRPEFDDSLSSFGDNMTHVQRLLTLHGLRINPSTLYKVTPWTWAVDWFTHFGDFIKHHDEFMVDGIVSRYLYVMKTTERHVTKTSVMDAWSGSRTFTWQRSLVKKQRKVADSPYGFDRPWRGLTAKQLAILGAIGISQSGSGFISRG